MKIDRSKVKKSTSEVPADCKFIIDKLKACSGNRDTLLAELQQIKTWTFGKCELFHWADVLDMFDNVLEAACKKEKEQQWLLPCDLAQEENLKLVLLQVLQFTSLLIEHSFTRHLYNSMEHLTTLLSSSDMTVVLAVLNLLYVFSKRSNFITRLSGDKKQVLVDRLTHLAESWGGKENGFGLAECCQDLPMSSFPHSATTLHFEYYADSKSGQKSQSVLSSIHVDSVDKVDKLAAGIMEDLMQQHSVPKDKQMLLLTHIRLAQAFSAYEKRIQCVQARLQAISVLVYSNAIQDNVNTILYTGFIEELVDVLQVSDQQLMEIKAAALRTLTSVIHLDRNPKLQNIIDATGASSYHGFLPVLVRNCIEKMTDATLEPFPQSFATALFSFLYHLASYECGGEALVSCGMMESLLKVINWLSEGQEHITFVTRAVRVVDLITNLGMQSFQSHAGLTTFINRLQHEVDVCRREQPYVIRPQRTPEAIAHSMEHGMPHSPSSPAAHDHPDSHSHDNPNHPVPMETDAPAPPASTSSQGTSSSTEAASKTEGGKNLVCFAQRAALLKSMLNFLKKAIPDPAFSDSIRHLMDGYLPRSLKHIISNAEYYGPSLFLLATDVVTVYVFQEPSLLSSLQDNGLTDVVLHALLVKDVPPTREVLASLPNVFSALCLNTRGLDAFVQCKPFDRLFKVLLSPDYLPAMRRRRSSDPPGDTASNLGSSMDELMRHQPSLRTEATKAIIMLLEEVCAMGRDAKYTCQKALAKNEQAAANVALRNQMATDGGSSEDDDEDDDEAAKLPAESASSEASTAQPATVATVEQASQEKTAIPLMDYVLNVMKFVEAILSNNTTDDHCREFVNQNGLLPLMGILGLPNLPIDFPNSQSCQAVAAVCKSIMTLSHEPQILEQGLLHLNTVLESLEPLHRFVDPPGGSVLLQELANASSGPPDPITSAQATPLLHGLTAAHAYVAMFSHVCKVGQTDMRMMSISHWGSDLGIKVLQGLSKLYTSLVWESTVLLAFCNEDILPPGCEFGRAHIEKLVPKDIKEKKSDSSEQLASSKSQGELGTNGVSHAMETLTTSDTGLLPQVLGSPMDTDDVPTTSKSDTTANSSSKKNKMSPALQAQIKQIKPILSVSSRLGRMLAELFGLLVKLCVGSPVRQRRTQVMPVPSAPSPSAQAVASELTKLLTKGLMWKPPECSPVPKLRLTFYICSVGFTSSMLFDEKKQPYHLMLQKFLALGGQEALFESFRWALTSGGQVPATKGMENDAVPEGTGEFLDVWLMLLEKLVNVKNVLDSPNTLPAKSSQAGYKPFNVVQYLIHTHKMAFDAVMYLWNKKPLKGYGSRMTESILAILCHIIKGEPVIKKLLKAQEEEEKKKTETAAAAPQEEPAPAAPAAPAVNPAHMQSLLDMGFSVEHATEALLQTTSLEAATEYCLTHPPPAVPQPPPQQSQAEAAAQEALKKEEERKAAEEAAAATAAEELNSRTEEPLSAEKLDTFCGSAVSGCMCLLDALPESVYRVCDLLTVVATRNGSTWRDDHLLTALVAEVAEYCLTLIDASYDCPDPKEAGAAVVNEWVDNFVQREEANKLATRLHLLSLLFEEMCVSCAECVETSDILDLLVSLLFNTQERLCYSTKRPTTPKWVAPLLLVLDLYEKISVASRRKVALEKIVGKRHQWKWFDDRTGRWCAYSVSNNKSIDDAYQAGDSTIRFAAGRRRYTVQFHNMVQVNEETGNRRPIMLSLPSKEDEGSEERSSAEPAAAAASSASKEQNKGEDSKEESKMDTEETSGRIMNGLQPDSIVSIIKCSVGLLSVPVEPDALHALLRILLRLTRHHDTALLFARLGGTRSLLALTQDSGFQGFTSLATLIFRHILEEPATLRHTMEKVVRSATSGTGSSSSGVLQNSMGSKEVHYVLRVLGPAACRQPDTFTAVVTQSLRISLPPPSNRDEDDARLRLSSTPQLLKCVSNKPPPLPPPVEPCVQDVIVELLNALIAKYVNNATEDKEGSGKEKEQSAAMEVTGQDLVTITRVPNDAAAAATAAEQKASATPPPAPSTTTEPKPPSKPEKLRPLLPKSAVLRLLAELVRSYAGVATLIASHTYKDPAENTCITEDMSALAFILDWLLPSCSRDGEEQKEDKDCSPLSRVLIATLAAANHSPDAQTNLVSEIKAALQRATALMESAEKHSRIQGLTSIISTIIEACPSAPPPPSLAFKGQSAGAVNNMVRLLLRKGVVTDLARITYSLDLSSPNMATTVNSALKPLETLSRIVNQPQPNILGGGKCTRPKAASSTGAAAAAGAGASSNAIEEAPIPLILEATEQQNTENTQREEGARAQSTEGDNVQIDVTIEDVTHDRDQQEGLEEAQPLSAIEPDGPPAGEESELESVLDTLLNRGPSPNSRRSGSGGGGDEDDDDEEREEGEIIMDALAAAAAAAASSDPSDRHDMLLDAMGMMDDHTGHHDSQMITQEISDDDGEDNTQDEDERDDEEVDEGDEDDVDDDDEDDDDIDEEDEGSDMEGEDEDEEEDDDFSDPLESGVDAAFQQLAAAETAADDLYVQLEEMLPSAGHPVMFGGDGAGPSNVPPAPSTVMPSHPLLVRHAESHSLAGSSSTLAARVHRAAANRQRGSYRYNPSTGTLHLHYNAGGTATAGGTRGGGGGTSNPPALLQRLLGQAGASDVFQLTSSISTGQARFHFITSDTNMRLLNNPDAADADAFDDFFFQDSVLDGGDGTGGSSVVASVPSALARWSEEARVLDGDSIHDGMTVLKPRILGELEAVRDAELAERKEKRKKQAQEDAAKKAASKESTTSSSSNPASSAVATTAGQSTITSSASSAPRGAYPPVSTMLEYADTIVSRIITSHIEQSATTTTATTSAPAVSAASSSAASASGGLPSSQTFTVDSGAMGSIPSTPGDWFAQVLAGTADQQTPPNPPRPLQPPDAPRRASAATESPGVEIPSHPASQMTPMDTSNIPPPSMPDPQPAEQRMEPGELLFTRFPSVPLPTPQPPEELLEPQQPQQPQQQQSQFVPQQVQILRRPDQERAITPEQPSDITSSDAVTINSSSTSTGNNSAEPSIADSDAPPPPSAPSGSSSLPVSLPAGAQNLTLDGANSHNSSATTIEMMQSALSSINSTLGDLMAATSDDMSSVHTNPDADAAEVSAMLQAAGSSAPATSGTSSAPATSSSSSAPAPAVAGSSGGAGPSSGGAYDESNLPEGVDPSFLAALPDNIRQEVIAEQLRLQRIQERAQEQQQQAAQLGVSEVSAEFLAALPPNIQEEVLAQQRAEQARVTAEQNATTAPQPEQDPASFISSLPPSLRQTVLADMDDSMVAVLPPALATEANMLRRELEDRHRRLMQERLFTQGSGGLSALLRQSGLAGRLGPTRYAMRPPQPRRHWTLGGGRGGTLNNASAAAGGASGAIKLRGRHLLDHEALTCLLVLLFVDDARLNTNRLHRVLRNLCYHGPTRAWIVRALLSMLQKTGVQCRPTCGGGASSNVSASSAAAASNIVVCDNPDPAATPRPHSAWLSISLEAALGCRANVFQMHKPAGSAHGKKQAGVSNSASLVTIHPQAAPIVCRHVLDTLISLAKSFPSYFLPLTPAAAGAQAKAEAAAEAMDKAASKDSTGSGPKTPSSSRLEPARDVDFWELLVRLDGSVGSKKGKSFQKQFHNTPADSSSVGGTEGAQSFDASPLGQLMSMLAHPVVRRSQQLTDRLLRLLGLVSIGFGNPTAATAASSASAPTSRQNLPQITRQQPTLASASAPVVQPSIAPAASESAGAESATAPSSDTTLTAGRSDDTLGLSETMDITTVPDEHLTSTPLPGKDTEVEKKQESAVLEEQLKLAVEVLTSKSCSEEGLEDATNLLAQLSRANSATRDTVLKLMLAGATTIGHTVQEHIRKLLDELLVLNMGKDEKESPKEDDDDAFPSTSAQKGVLQDRFGGGSIVVHAPSKVKVARSGRELQLPSMAQLTSKMSSQHFLLRILKVIIQLRDAAKDAATQAAKSRRQQHDPVTDRDFSHIPEALAMFDGGEAETIMELVGMGDPQPPTSSASQPTPAQAPSAPTSVPMEVDTAAAPSSSGSSAAVDQNPEDEDELSLPRLSEQLCLDELWATLGECLSQLASTTDHHAVLVLQPAVEAFFMVHAGEKTEKSSASGSGRGRGGSQAHGREDLDHLNIDLSAPMSPANVPASDSQMSLLSRQDSVLSSTAHTGPALPPDTAKFLKFAETHRTVLNQILRQSNTPLADGPFSVLVDHTRILDFDVKRRYFRQELERIDDGGGVRREDLAVHVRREHVFEDSFRDIHRRSTEEWKHRFYIVFEGEEGQDAGGLLREWYLIMSREIFNPNYALFMISPGDRVTYTINPSSHCNSNHLSYFKFVGRFLAKAVYDNKLLECYFTRSFYKHILSKPVHYTDMESEDYSFYQGLVFLLEHNIRDLGYELSFSTEIQEFGKTEIRDLKPNGRNLPVSEENKKDYIKLVCVEKMTGAIKQQLHAFLEGFYDIIPKRLISIFNEQELELLISGLPTVDIDDLKTNTEYHKYQTTSLQIQWFWRALRTFDQADRAAFLQFVTGTSKVPLQGFAYLEGMNGIQKFQIHRDDRSTERLPCAHTCFNQLDLPAYETYDKLRSMLLTAIHECSEGFGLA